MLPCRRLTQVFPAVRCKMLPEVWKTASMEKSQEIKQQADLSPTNKTDTTSCLSQLNYYDECGDPDSTPFIIYITPSNLPTIHLPTFATSYLSTNPVLTFGKELKNTVWLIAIQVAFGFNFFNVRQFVDGTSKASLPCRRIGLFTVAIFSRVASPLAKKNCISLQDKAWLSGMFPWDLEDSIRLVEPL